jgi:hypothetical protein
MKSLTFQAIVTKYIGPSNIRGSRVKATAAAGSVTLHWDSSLNSDDNHARAAEALATKYGWRGNWYGGGMPDGRGNVYVCSDRDSDPVFVTWQNANV